MTTISIRGVSLFVKIIEQGYPLALMHGGPGVDHTTLLSLQPLADRLTLVFYDHRFGEIKAPTLVMAGRYDFQFPPEHQAALAAGIPNARLEIIEHAGHNAHSERPVEVLREIRRLMAIGYPEWISYG